MLDEEYGEEDFGIELGSWYWTATLEELREDLNDTELSAAVSEREGDERNANYCSQQANLITELIIKRFPFSLEAKKRQEEDKEFASLKNFNPRDLLL